MRLAIAIAALALAAQVGCGGDDLEGSIPQESADTLLEQLDGLRDAVESGNCTTAETDASQFVEAVNSLPEETGAELKGSLREAGQNLDRLVASDCVESGATGETGPVEEEPTTTTPAPAPVEPVPPAESEGEGGGPPEQPPGEGEGAPPGTGSDSGPGSDDDSGGIGQEKSKQKESKRKGGKG